MFANDREGDAITWSAASDHSCSFLRIVSQDANSPSRAIAGGAAPANFSGTCLIRFKACDRLGACGVWGGSYTWIPELPQAPPLVALARVEGEFLKW
jgi:hypothetical protein